MNEAAAVSSTSLVLGRYRPLRPLGSGGSGSVWLARDERHGLDVALKIVAREGKAGTRAEREARAAAQLRHPHCLRAYALARDGDHVYVAYEYVPGSTLREAMRRGELDDAALVEAAAQVLEGLAHAHARGIVHRDVKPANVLLAAEDRSVRLLDFGLAQLPDQETLTATGDVPGTLAYISPERLRGEATTAASDVWAVGVILYEGLAGGHPFWSGSVVDTAKLIAKGAAPLASERPDLPRQLTALVDRALSLEPGKRPPASRLAAALRETGTRRPRARREVAVPRLPHAARVAAAGFAALVAGWTTSALPFFPAQLAPAFALVAAALALWRGRAALAFALAMPILPFGNVSLGLALLYSAVAAGWLALFWRDARSGLAFCIAPLLAPLGCLGLLPLAVATVGSPLRRGLLVGAGTIVAAVVAGIRHAALPFTGESAPLGIGLAGADSPVDVAGSLVRELQRQHVLATETALLAAAAVALPYVRGRGLVAIAAFGAVLLGTTVAAAPGLHSLPLAGTACATCVTLAALERRRGKAGH